MDRNTIITLIDKYQASRWNDVHSMKTLHFVSQYENFWQRENEYGHITASAWVINHTRNKALLTHHKKLNIWVQLGGHIEPEDKDIMCACERELKEESGLSQFRILSRDIFDIDVHSIPMNSKGFPEHFHFDIRFIFEANSNEMINFDQEESNDVQWIYLNEIKKFTTEPSIWRMVEKSSSF